MIIQGTGIYEAWTLLLDELLRAPVVRPRGKPCRERLGVQLRVTDATKNIILDAQRRLNYRFMVAEFLWVLGGLNRLDVLTRYNKRMAEFSDDGVTLTGAYGPRLQSQWAWLVKKFVEDRETRQAVVSIWTPTPASSKDVPCTLATQYLLREEHAFTWALHTVVTMRSSDAWWGIPYDVFTFSMLAHVLAAELIVVLGQPISLGSLVVNLGSSHLYEPHWETARSIVNAPTGASGRSPHLPARRRWLPVGVLEALADPTQPGEAYALATMPWPWNKYVEVLRAQTSAEALVILQGLEQGEAHAAVK